MQRTRKEALSLSSGFPLPLPSAVSLSETSLVWSFSPALPTLILILSEAKGPRPDLRVPLIRSVTEAGDAGVLAQSGSDPTHSGATHSQNRAKFVFG